MITDTLKNIQRLKAIRDGLQSGGEVELSRADLSCINEAIAKLEAVLKTWVLSAKGGRGRGRRSSSALPASVDRRLRRELKRMALVEKIEANL
jgi:hypothetical protein